MPESKYPSTKNIFLLCLTFTGLNFLAEIISQLLIYFLELSGLNLTDNLTSLISLSFSLSVYFFIIKALIKKSYVKSPAFFYAKRINLYIGFIFLMAFAGSLILFSQINYIFYYLFPMPEFLVDIFSEIFHLESLLISLMLIIIMPALLEEVLFRGFILFGLRKNHSAGKSIFISALFFGLVHLNPWQFITAFLSGLLFAWVALKTKSIILPILGHFLNNTMALVSSRYFDSEINPSGKFELTPIPILISAIILTISGVYLLHQYKYDNSIEKEAVKDEIQTGKAE